MAGANRQALLVVGGLNKGKNIIVIVEGLAGPHDDDMGHAPPPFSEEFVHDEHFAHHFACGEIAALFE